MPSIQVACGSCRATGLYQGLMEDKGRGEAVVCLDCKGSGARELNYEPFTGRKRRPGVERIMVRATGFILEGNNPATTMTYNEFETKFRAAKVSN